MSKHGFIIKPKNKKLLKSSKVRKWFAYVEDRIAEEIERQEMESFKRLEDFLKGFKK